MRYFSTPKLQLSLILITIILLKLFVDFSTALLIYFLTVISLTVLVDFLFVWARKIKPFLFSAAIVTGSIIALLNQPKTSFFGVFMIIVLAISSKHFLKFKGRHIFNPAAFGLFFGSLIFKIPVAWWGISSGTWWMLILLLSTSYVSIFRSRKIYTILAFFIIYNAVTYLLTGFINPLDPVLIFFAFVMLPEPMTSPNKPILQIYFGGITAFLTIFLSNVTIVSEVLLGSLLMSNLLFFNKK